MTLTGSGELYSKNLLYAYFHTWKRNPTLKFSFVFIKHYYSAIIGQLSLNFTPSKDHLILYPQWLLLIIITIIEHYKSLVWFCTSIPLFNYWSFLYLSRSLDRSLRKINVENTMSHFLCPSKEVGKCKSRVGTV